MKPDSDKMEGAYRDKYSFIGEWYDNQASLIRRFNIFFYPIDNTIEMFDLKTRKTFVRRLKVQGIKLDNFYIGGMLYVLGRLVKIVDFACDDTKKKLQEDVQAIFVLLKPIPTNIAGKIITQLNESGLRIVDMKKVRVSVEDINVIYRRLLTDPTFAFVKEYLNGKLVYGMKLVGKDAYNVCIKIAGDRDPAKAAPGTIRALYGSDAVRNCIHIPVSRDDCKEDLDYFFPPPALHSSRLPLTATLSNCTLCIVKPHAIQEGKLGHVLEAIDEGGFDITALNMFVVENINAAEFYEVYKGIVPEYKGMVDELASGPCVAMEIVSKNKSLNSAIEFRKIVGPVDPQIARLLRPHTLRAKLGNNKVQNAIHCSDLPEDGLLEVEYFFKILV